MAEHKVFAVEALLGALSAGCNVSISGPMLQGDLFVELRDAALLTQLCGFPVAEAEANSASSFTLQLADSTGTRPLLGSEGHGSARVLFTPRAAPQPGQRFEGNIEFDFSQQARITGRTRRSVSTSSTFYFSNVRFTGR